jgi:hypothetical protein
MDRMNHRARKLATIAALAAFALPGAATGQTVDDTFLLTTSVAPNVVMIFDNSYRMNEIEWHWAFDQGATYACSAFDPNVEYEALQTYVIEGVNKQLKNTVTLTGPGCANSRKIFVDSETSVTLYDGRYLNWYFSDAADPYITEIETKKASQVGCNQAGGGVKFMELYRRTRNSAARHVLTDVLCLAEPKNLRFGMAQFRSPGLGGDDPNGGYVAIGVGRNQPTHAANMEAAIKVLKDDNWAPVSESIFQLYTYLMPRTATACPSSLSTPTYCRPMGNDGATNFPLYSYDKDGNYDTGSTMLPDPIDCDPTTTGLQPCPCQKSFIIMVTGGEGSRDDFDAETPTNTANGFDPDFDALIGNYYADAETEEGGSLVNEDTRYLDDIAKYMQEHDLRPDLEDDQTVDLYVVGFGTTDTYDAYLQRAADLGNGLFFHAKDGEQLSTALVAALNDIVEKARSFTAATVPSSRTADGSDFYNSFFIPSGDHAFWEGHLRSWKFSAAGEILDSAGHCALDDPDGASQCNNGPFKKSCQVSETWPACVVPYWDAGDATKAAVVPGDTNADTNARLLYTSKLNTLVTPAVPERTDLDQNLQAAEMNISPFAAAPDPAPNSAQYPLRGSLALTEEGLADEVVAYARGCFFGTGALANVSTVTPCAERPWLVGDIFHSDPIVVRQPPERTLGSAYDTFRNAYIDRDRVIYSGTNGGFLEAFHAGTWNTSTLRYDEGTGVEKFGFMPWEPRRKIKKQIVDDPTARTHYVDGAPQVVDAWLYDTATVAAQTAADWRTILAGGLREGGRHYYALDVTNPSNDSGAPAGNLAYPAVQWEFPNENDFNSGTGDYVDMGQTWGQPVLARVKLNVGIATNGGAGFERWVAIVTGGYEETSDPNPNVVSGTKLAVDTSKAAYNAASTKGRAIYMLDLKTGKVIAQQKMGFNGDADGATTPEAGMLFAIPSTPSVLDLDADGYADVVYVGDLGGNVWKWVIKPVGEDRANDGSSVRTQPNWKFHKFFNAPPTNIAGSPWYYKNIFQPPAAAFSNNKLWLAFGTGERAAIGFLGDPAAGRDEVNRYYVVNDPDPLLTAGIPATLTESGLTNITTVGTPVTSPRGYFFKAAEAEKFVTTSVIFAGKVIVASFTPSLLKAGDPGFDPCTQRGSGNLYKFSLTTGVGDYLDASSNESRYTSLGSGLPTDPKISIGVGGDNNKIVVQDSGTSMSVHEADDATFGRGIIYWRERH